MFKNCGNLTSIKGLNFWRTPILFDMTNFLCGCERLRTVNVGKFLTGNVVSLRGVFRGCKEIKKVEVGSWETGNVRDMRRMFEGCGKLTSFDLSNFSTENCVLLEGLFSDCESLEHIKGLENFYTFGTSFAMIYVHYGDRFSYLSTNSKKDY